MVLPLLILSVITCLLVSMFFYDTTIRQCQLHLALRQAAGDLTGHTIYPEESPWDGDALQLSRAGIFQTVSGKEHTDMIHQGILRSRVSRDLESLWHASDGVTYVRYYTLAKDIADQR